VNLVHMVKSGRQPRTEDPMTPRRLTYVEIADDLAARIAAGEYPPGSQLPSYSRLADLYSVSVATAQRAITVLRVRGAVRGEPGRGVFVPDPDDGAE
jgi:GntR family transcriptional regulator